MPQERKPTGNPSFQSPHFAKLKKIVYFLQKVCKNLENAKCLVYNKLYS